jgi:hypothetical protein
MERTLAGRCLCGDVAFSLHGPFRSPTECHCGQCRRWHGHTGVYTNVKRSAVTFSQDRGLTWFASSDIARRGFCRTCGSSLFWDDPTRETISVTAGCIDGATGLTIAEHIYTKDKGDYYSLPAGAVVRPSNQDRDATKK